jgi:hypothetical protein
MKTASHSIMLAIALCSGPLLAQPFDSTRAAAKTSANTSQPDVNSLEQQIVAKEREGLEALKSGNLELFGNLTSEDAVFVDSQGPATKAQVMKNVQNFRLVDFSMQDVKFVFISPTSGLISYKATEKGTSHGREFTAVVYVSSVWTLREGKWVCQFSQETAAPKPMQQ